MLNGKKEIYILMILLIISIVNAQGFGNCPFGDYGFGDSCALPPPKKEEPSGGGSSILNPDAKPALAEAIRTNQTPTCSKGNQYFEGACYPFSEDGILFRRIDGTIGCVKCDEGAEYDGKGGCKKIVTPINKTGFNAMELGSKITPKNPYVGFALMAIPTIGLLYWLYTRFTYAKKYEQLKKKKEEEGKPMEEEKKEEE